MKLIAKHTIHAKREISPPIPARGEKPAVPAQNGQPAIPAQEARPAIPGQYETVTHAPGAVFDPAEFGIGEDEVRDLIKRKAVVEKGRVSDESEAEGEHFPLSPETAPRGPSVTTEADDPAVETTRRGRRQLP